MTKSTSEKTPVQKALDILNVMTPSGGWTPLGRNVIDRESILTSGDQQMRISDAEFALLDSDPKEFIRLLARKLGDQSVADEPLTHAATSVGDLQRLVLDLPGDQMIRARVGDIDDYAFGVTDDRILQLRRELEAARAEQASAPSPIEFRRAEAVELVSEMLAGAGFELIRDAPGEPALWIQHLAQVRPWVQVFVQVPDEVLVAAPPRELYRRVKQQLGES